MKALLFMIGALFIIVGTYEVLYTDKFRKGIAGLTAKVSLRALGVLPLALGALLMASAFWSRSFWMIEILGILAIAKGILLFVLPKEKATHVLMWWQEKLSDTALRFWGLVLVILGTFLTLRA